MLLWNWMGNPFVNNRSFTMCENTPFCSLFEQLTRETYGGWKFMDHKSLLDCIMNSGPGDTILSFQLSHLLY